MRLVNIGICGLGTVGAGVPYFEFDENADHANNTDQKNYFFLGGLAVVVIMTL